MHKLWSDRAWDDYLYWQQQNKKVVSKINELVKEMVYLKGLANQNRYVIEKHGAEELIMKID